MLQRNRALRSNEHLGVLGGSLAQYPVPSISNFPLPPAWIGRAQPPLKGLVRLPRERGTLTQRVGLRTKD